MMEAGEATLAYHQCRDCEVIYFEPKADCDYCGSGGTVDVMSEADMLACALLWGDHTPMIPTTDFVDQAMLEELSRPLTLVWHESDACVFLPESV